MRWMLISSAIITMCAAVFLERNADNAMASDVARAADLARATEPMMSDAPAWENRSWLNTDSPATLASLEGRVILLNFWVYTCYNCTNTVPSLVAFDSTYRKRGLTIIGIHTPEFPPYAGEHDKGNVAKAIGRYDIRYPVAQDNDRATWNLYRVGFWPSFVLIDKQGRIRYEGHGEFHVGDRWHKEWAQRIERLLVE